MTLDIHRRYLEITRALVLEGTSKWSAKIAIKGLNPLGGVSMWCCCTVLLMLKPPPPGINKNSANFSYCRTIQFINSLIKNHSREILWKSNIWKKIFVYLVNSVSETAHSVNSEKYVVEPRRHS